MSAAGDARPWWASEDGVDAPDPDPDPIGRHRAARRGAAEGDPAASTDDRTASADDRAASADDRAASADDRTASADDANHRVDACGVCPICVGLRLLGEVRPDLVAHLNEAARHLSFAVRSVVDASAEPASRPPDDLTRIDLDEDGS